MNDDLDFSGNNRFTDQQMKEFQRAFQKQKMDEHEAQEEHRRKVAMGLMKQEEWDPKAWDEETDQQRAQFDAFTEKRDADERNRLEFANAQSFMLANPRYIPNPNNSANIQAFLKQHGLPATTVNLQRAYQELTPILDLRPETVRPPRTYTEAELWTLPMEDTDPWGLNPDAPPTLISVCNQAVAQEEKLKQIAAESEEQW